MAGFGSAASAEVCRVEEAKEEATLAEGGGWDCRDLELRGEGLRGWMEMREEEGRGRAFGRRSCEDGV